MTILALVFPLLEPKLSTFLMTSKPSTTCPKTTCLPSSLVERSHGVKVRTGQDTPQHGPRSVLMHGHSQFFCSPWSKICADEELGTIGVGASIGHGKAARASVFQGKVLVLKLVTINWLATSSIVVREVTSLYPKVSRLKANMKNKLRSQKAFGNLSYLAHEVGDDTMEGGSFVAKARLTCAQLPEVLCKTTDRQWVLLINPTQGKKYY